MERTEELEAEAHVRLLEDTRAFAKALLVRPPEFLLRRVARRHDPCDHTRAVDGGGKLRGGGQLGKGFAEGGVVLPKLNRKIDYRRPELQSREKIICRRRSSLHGGLEHNVGSREANTCSQLGELGPVHPVRNQYAVQGEKHVAPGSIDRQQCR